MTPELQKHILRLWDYMNIDQVSRPADLVMAFGTSDPGPARRAVEIYQQNYASLILFAGNRGEHSKLKKPEALWYKEVATQMGAPDEVILTESRSTNSEENVHLSYQLIQKKGISANGIILVQKPVSLRRFRATFLKFWPNKHVDLQMTCEQTSPDEYLFHHPDGQKRIEQMVGDLQRLYVYAESNYRDHQELFRPKDWEHIQETDGFSVTEDIPEDVWESWSFVKDAGYDKRLIQAYRG